jgi:predicted nucleic acid-binding protein
MNNGRRIRYVLDTDTTSAIQRRQPAVSERLAGTDPEIVATTVVTLYEQFRGRLAVVSRARNAMSLQAAFDLLLETADICATSKSCPSMPTPLVSFARFSGSD